MENISENRCFGYIYQITNIQNKKSYIGYTTFKNPIKYISRHFDSAIKNKDKNRKYFYNAIRKYGVQNFKWRILGDCDSFEELKDAEKECIYFFRTFGKDGVNEDSIYGYNMTLGGDGTIGRIRRGFKHTEESKKNMSDAHKGQKPSLESLEKGKQTKILNGTYRKSPDEETKKIISQKLMGHTLSQETIDKGKMTRILNDSYKQNEETRKKISDNAKINPNYGMKGKHHSQYSINKRLETIEANGGLHHTKESKEKIRIALKGKPKFNKGKNNVEVYGEEKAKEIGDKKREAIKRNNQIKINKKVSQELDYIIGL